MKVQTLRKDTLVMTQEIREIPVKNSNILHSQQLENSLQETAVCALP